MGYLDYTLQKLNAINQMNEQRYREKRLEEETKSQFLNSLVGLVPQAISGISDAADKRAVEEDALNKLRLQEALLTGGDNTLAGIRPLTGANTLAPAAKGPVAAAPAAANTFGFINKPIEEEDNSLPGSERVGDSDVINDKDLEGPVPDEVTSPMYELYDRNTERMRQEDLAEENAAAGSPAPTADAGLASLLSKLAPALTTGARSMGNTSAFPNVNVTTPDIEPQQRGPVDLSLREREGAVVPGEIPVPAARPVAVPPVAAAPVVAPPVVDPLAKLGAPAPAPLPLPAAPTTRAMESAALDTRRGGPTMPGAVGDENIEGEAPAAYRKRMEAKGYNPKKVNELIKKYYVTGSGTVDITEDTGTGGPRAAKPFQIGGDNPPTFSGSGTGGFGGGPVAGKPWIKEKKVIPEGEKPAVVVPEVPQLSVTEQLRNEEKDRQDALNKRLVNYKRLTNDDFKEPDIDKLAEKAVSEIFTKRPPGNPISEMLNNITGAGQMTAERERLMRSIAKKTIVKNIKAERKAIADADAESFINKTKLEIDSAFKAGKTLGLQTSKKQIPDSARKELDSQNEANIMLNDVRDEAYQIAAETGTVPVGKKRFLTEALINKIASETGQSGKTISAGLLGLSLGGGKSQAGPFVDPDLLVKAFKATDFSDLSPKEQKMVQLMTQSIQVLGKAREGGKLTDADYNKYVSTLFNSDNPAAFIASLDDLIDRNAARYNKNLVYFNKNYGDDLSMFDAAGRREQEYELDWNQIQEKPLSTAAAAVVGGGGSEKKKNPSSPKPSPPKVDSDF